MVFDPNKQPVQRHRCANALTINFVPWTVSWDVITAGVLSHCGLVTAATPIGGPLVLFRDPGLFAGRCQWSIEIGGIGSGFDTWQFNLFWNPFLLVPPAWYLAVTHFPIVYPGVLSYEQSAWLGPTTLSTIGAYQAVDDDGNPVLCTTPDLLSISL